MDCTDKQGPDCSNGSKCLKLVRPCLEKPEDDDDDSADDFAFNFASRPSSPARCPDLDGASASARSCTPRKPSPSKSVKPVKSEPRSAHKADAKAKMTKAKAKSSAAKVKAAPSRGAAGRQKAAREIGACEKLLAATRVVTRHVQSTDKAGSVSANEVDSLMKRCSQRLHDDIRWVYVGDDLEESAAAERDQRLIRQIDLPQRQRA